MMKTPLIYVEPHQEIFGQLNLKPTEAGELTIEWLVHKPFRPLDFLLWGTNSRTCMHGFKVGITEQIVAPFPFLHVFRAPNYSLEDLIRHLEPAGADAVKQDHFEHARLQNALLPTNKPLLATASPGNRLTMRLSGAITHAIVLGIAID